ncbi:MAG: hypothetical protein C0407_16555 [Desulfobacca sp.]|nr:hypothetical protein [Desulfobacca sp.]
MSLCRAEFHSFLNGVPRVCSHPETTSPDENIQLPALSMSRNPLKKSFWRELNAVPVWGP